MRKILVSACLCGRRCRYDGKSKPLEHPVFERWKEERRLVEICPEVAGGLPVPRVDAQRRGDRIMTRDGRDVTEEYRKGAEEALRLAYENRVALCLMKEKSPSCGTKVIYDGTFSGELTPGEGLTTESLRKAGYDVFGEDRMDEAVKLLEEVEEGRR